MPEPHVQPRKQQRPTLSFQAGFGKESLRQTLQQVGRTSWVRWFIELGQVEGDDTDDIEPK